MDVANGEEIATAVADYRRGEAHYMKYLTDGEVAQAQVEPIALP